MSQQKYIMSAILLIAVGAAIYYGFRKLPQGKDAYPTSTIIDYDEPADGISEIQSDGKRIYQSKCASCHTVFKNTTGPALFAVAERGPWKDSTMLNKYIRKPESFGKSEYIDSLRRMYGSKHMGFPDLTGDEIRAIFRYINVEYRKPVSDIID